MHESVSPVTGWKINGSCGSSTESGVKYGMTFLAV